MGVLYQLWDIKVDPDDPSAPYTPYTFDPRVITQDRSFARRESIMAIPGLDSTLDSYGYLAAPTERREFKWTFRVVTAGKVDRAYDLLMAQVAGPPQRLVYLTDPLTNSPGYLRITEGHFLSCQAVGTNEQNSYYDFTVNWRIQPWWRARHRESADLFTTNDGVFADGTIIPFETFSAPNTYFLGSATTNITLNNSGTAGYDLPTLADSAVHVGIAGPFGGSQGILIQNWSALTPDLTGAMQPMTLIIPFALAAGESVSLDFGSMSFIHGTLAFRPVRPSYQREWMKVVPNNNSVVVSCYGGSPVASSSAYIAFDWYRKFV